MNTTINTSRTSKTKVMLAPYQRSLYKDKDSGYIATFMVPMGLIDLYQLIESLKDYVYINGYMSVRLHGYEMNQPIRIVYDDDDDPIIVLVLQVYGDITKNDSFFLSY